MNRKEFATMASLLKEYYAKDNFMQTEKVIELWFNELQDIPVELAKATTHKWITTQKWAPTISEFRKMAADIAQGDLPDWSESWKNVQSAIRKYGTWNAGKAKAELDEITRQTVERIGYNELCNSTNIAVDRANFRMIYEQIAKRKAEKQLLPANLQRQICAIAVKQLEGETK